MARTVAPASRARHRAGRCGADPAERRTRVALRWPPSTASPTSSARSCSCCCARASPTTTSPALLKSEPSKIRARARGAVAAVGPDPSEIESERRDEIADYLLGQQTASQRAATREYLEGSAAGRTWARAAAAALAPLGGDSLPDIPAEREEVAEAFDALDRRTARQAEVKRSSQLGTKLLLGGVGVIVGIAIILALNLGDGDEPDTTAATTTADRDRDRRREHPDDADRRQVHDRRAGHPGSARGRRVRRQGRGRDRALSRQQPVPLRAHAPGLPPSRNERGLRHLAVHVRRQEAVPRLSRTRTSARTASCRPSATCRPRRPPTARCC